MDPELEMYRELTEAPGPPGAEGPVRAVMEKYLRPLGELVYDNLGSIAARKTGTPGGPRIMVAGHMDEVGFLVTQITERGFLRFQTLGGWWEPVMVAQRVQVLTVKGTLEGIIGSKPPHILSADERKKALDRKYFFIDIGASSREEAAAFGVRPGDPVVPVCPFHVTPGGQVLMAKAWDNRSGCAVAIQVLQMLQGQDHPNEVYACATVQEEVGLRGAGTLAYQIQPDIAIALDVGIATDTPEIESHQRHAAMGKGPVVLLYDASLVPNLRLRNLFFDVAAQEGIPLQFDAMAGGGTDAGEMHRYGSGVPAIAIGFASRYIHSPASLIHRQDLRQAAQLVCAVIQRLDAALVAEIKGAL